MNLPMKEKKWNVIFNKTFHEINYLTFNTNTGIIQFMDDAFIFYYLFKYIETDLWMLLDAKIFLQNN